jgi:hypothetical protein
LAMITSFHILPNSSFIYITSVIGH